MDWVFSYSLPPGQGWNYTLTLRVSKKNRVTQTADELQPAGCEKRVVPFWVVQSARIFSGVRNKAELIKALFQRTQQKVRKRHRDDLIGLWRPTINEMKADR